MLRAIRIPLFIAAMIVVGFTTVRAESTLLLRQPTVSDSHVAFRYAGDIWIANRDGSQPRRLTVHQAVENDPFFSPDGQWIAFTGEYSGNKDVFVVSVEGGAPKRLTYHPESDRVRGWTPDGEILFLSTRDSHTGRVGRLFTVGIEGGFPNPFILPRADRGSLSPDGKKIAYTYTRESFTWWRRYGGGRSGPIRIFDTETLKEIEIPRVGSSNEAQPVWLGSNIYFLSDRNFTMNVFVYDTETGDIKQLTQHDEYDVKTLKGSGSTLAFEQAGKIHLYEINTGDDTTLDIYVNPDIPAARPRYEDVSDEIDWFSISPNGKRALFDARGDVLTVPAEKGDTRLITETSDVHERYPIWSPDGSQIAFFSDARGEYNLHIIDHLGKGEQQVLSLGPIDDYDQPKWSPDGKSLLYRDNGLNLFVMDLKSGKRKLVDSDPVDVRRINAVWSPDSRYVAYTRGLDNDFRAIFAYEMKSGKKIQLTDGRSDATSPAFSRDGKYLFFSSSTDYAFQVSGLDMSAYDKRVDRNLYLIVLSKETPHPFPRRVTMKMQRMRKRKVKTLLYRLTQRTSTSVSSPSIFPQVI